MSLATPPTVGKRIRLLRETLGLTQKEMGEELGVSGSYISMVERDKEEPSLMLRVLICTVYGVEISWLMDGKPPMFMPIQKRIRGLLEQYGKDEILEGLKELGLLSDVVDLHGQYLLPLASTDRQDVAFRKLIAQLITSWRTADIDVKGWILVQLRRAFPELEEDVQKKQHPTSSAGAGTGA